MPVYDAAIIGGGLAGCSAALTLARNGWKVILFEAKSYPHHKVCGEFLSPECEVILDQLGVVEAIRDIKPASIHDVLITVPDGFTWKTSLPGIAMGISRYWLDAILAKHAQSLNVELCENSTATGIEGNLDTGFTVRTRDTEIRARTVIAAHGKRSTVDRLLDRDFLKIRQPFVAIKAHFEGTPVLDRVELHTFPGGYCGLSNIEDGKINLCLLTRAERFQQFADIHLFIDWMRRQNPHLDAWFPHVKRVTDWLTIAQVPFNAKHPIERDIFMVGDAARLIAPLAGNGMSMALYGGRLVAEVLQCFLNGQTSVEDTRKRYQTLWYERFSARLRLGRFLQAVLLRPSILSPGLRFMAHIPSIGQYFIAHTRERSFE